MDGNGIKLIRNRKMEIRRNEDPGLVTFWALQNWAGNGNMEGWERLNWPSQWWHDFGLGEETKLAFAVVA